MTFVEAVGVVAPCLLALARTRSVVAAQEDVGVAAKSLSTGPKLTLVVPAMREQGVEEQVRGNSR